MSELLRMVDIHKSFGQVKAVNGVSLSLNQGEILALMGENGAGKSTLMNILSGALKNYEGSIYIQGKKVSISSPLEAASLGIAKIHQELQLVGELSIAENMFMGREKVKRLGFIDKKQTEGEAQKYLDMMNLGISAKRSINSLRVGEQQLVEIAKAISMQAKILIMDEPTSAISKNESERLFAIVRQLAREGVGIIYITHRMEEVFELADNLMVMRDGLYVGRVPTAQADRNQIISMMVGRELSDVYPAGAHQAGEEVLRVEHLSLKGDAASYQRSLYDISFSLKRGEILGIGGLLGAGRTELLEAIFGLHPHRIKGDIYVNSRPCHFNSPADAIQSGLAYAMEDRKGQGLVLLRSIGENMSLPKLRQLTKAGFMNTTLERAQWQKQMEAMSIKAESFDTLAGTLSGGNQQKVVLGRWMMMNPDILLLDEPTRGIDVGAKAEIYSLIQDLAASGMGILFVSSELPEIIGISDRVLTLCEGRLTGEFLKEEATQEKLLYAATLREGASA